MYFSKFEKCQFEDYKKAVSIPDWVEKGLNKSLIYELSKPSSEADNQRRMLADLHKKDVYSYMEKNCLE